jgi:hypothetical protein
MYAARRYYDDAVDKETKERKLSLNRAKNVYKYFITKGVNSLRMKYIGCGNKFPPVWEMLKTDVLSFLITKARFFISICGISSSKYISLVCTNCGFHRTFQIQLSLIRCCLRQNATQFQLLIRINSCPHFRSRYLGETVTSHRCVIANSWAGNNLECATISSNSPMRCKATCFPSRSR